MYTVKEIFYTLQGEGAQTGRPAVFCRFSGCNLWTGREADRATAICSFCDTDFVGTGPDGGRFADAKALARAVAAQWPPFEAKRAPRKADGTVDLAAPAPRAADGRPDFSGLWERSGPGGANPDFDALQSPDGGPPAATFWSLGAGFRGGLPYTPLAALLREERMANDQKNNPDARCLPMGLMQLHLHPQPRKIVQTPKLIVIMYEGNQGLRQIFLDGRELPEVDENLQPWWYGYSVGRWEGDTLVVESVGFRDGGWLDVFGSPLTDRGKLIERWRRPDYGHLEIDVTVDDPKAYTRPFTVRVSHQVLLDQELIEFICNENEKSSQHYDP